MRNHQFTDKQINNFIKRNKNKKGWLNTRQVRSENMVAQETRYLMRLMCEEELGLAFDNELSPQDERYEICFDLDTKDMMIEELDRFDRSVLLHPVMMEIPSESLLGKESTQLDFLYWKRLLENWIAVYKGFVRYQNGQKIDDFQVLDSFSPIIGINEKLYKKDKKEFILMAIHKFIKMYKALKIGWKDIKHIYANYTYNTLFICILREYYEEKFSLATNFNEPHENKIIHSPKTVVLARFQENMKIYLESLSNDGKIDRSDRKFYMLTLEEYKREPHGQGLEKAFGVLKKVVQKDIHVRQSFIDFYDALSVIGKFHHKSFDAFLECDGIEDFSLNYDRISNDAFVVDRVLHQIREVLRSSSDSRVRAAVSEWVAAESKILDFDVKISRRNAQNSKKRR
jgi:hypothetical protein